MPIFEYKAKDKEGQTEIGTVEATSENVAQDVLKEKDLVIISIAERRKVTFLQSSLGIFNRVPSRDRVIFARQLSVMISAMVPITKALRILVKQTSNVTFKIIISEVADEVDGGAKLSASLGHYPQVFSRFFIHMIRSGETSGKLDETLNYLADQMEKDYALTSKIRNAMIYPAFIMGGLLVVGAVMMIFVIPQLTSVLIESGVKLPMTTRMLIATSNFLKNDWWLLLMILIGLFIGFRYYNRTPMGKIQIDKIKIRAPLFGKIFKQIYITRFSQSLATLIASGIPLIAALEIVAEVVDNSIYQDLIRRTIKEIEDGNPISTVFVQSADVPPMLTQMLNIGEQTGRLDYILGKLAEFYAREVEGAVTSLVTLLEPMVMVVMGVAVGILVAAVLLPMYNLSSAI